MKQIKISLKLYNEIKDFCLLNNIKNLNKEIESMLEKGFNFTKYGTSPFKTNSKFLIIPKEEVNNNVEKQQEPLEKNDKQDIEETFVEQQIVKQRKKGINIIKK